VLRPRLSAVPRVVRPQAGELAGPGATAAHRGPAVRIGGPPGPADGRFPADLAALAGANDSASGGSNKHINGYFLSSFVSAQTTVSTCANNACPRDLGTYVLKLTN
jgi:hypothetical protein